MLDKFHIFVMYKVSRLFCEHRQSDRYRCSGFEIVASPQYFAFLSGQTDVLQLYARVMSCGRAKLNLSADKRLCNRDSSKCLSEGHSVQE